MSLKPITPRKPAARRGMRPMGAPVVIVQKKSSGGAGGLIVAALLVLALGGGYFVYNNEQKNQAALAAQKQRMEENAQRVAEAERQRAEYEAKRQARQTALGSTDTTTALGTATPAADSPSDSYDDASAAEEETVAAEEEVSALGSTGAPTKGDGVFQVDDTTPPPFELNAKGKAGQKVIAALDKAIDKAGDEGTFHDLQVDLKRSFDVAQPELFADARTLPAFPDKEEKLLRMAHGVYACLNLASELEARNTVPEKDHARFVCWLMKDKAKAARTFTYGVVEHCGITDVSTAADLLDEVRQAYLISPSSGMKKIPAILKEHAKQ